MKQRKLSHYIYVEDDCDCESDGFKCRVCGKEFGTRKGLKIHQAKKHFFYADEGVTVERQKDHVILHVIIRETLYDTLQKTVRRSGVDLHRFFGEVIHSGDALFDENVKKYHAEKVCQIITQELVQDGKKADAYIA